MPKLQIWIDVLQSFHEKNFHLILLQIDADMFHCTYQEWSLQNQWLTA